MTSNHILIGIALAIGAAWAAARRGVKVTEAALRNAIKQWAADNPLPFDIDLLVVLAKRESSLALDAVTGSHVGLWQLRAADVATWLEDRKLPPAAMESVETQVAMAMDHFSKIRRSYDAVLLTPRTVASQEDYDGLVIAGHNAGYSRAAGVAKVWEEWRKADNPPLRPAQIPTAAKMLRELGVDVTEHLANADAPVGKRPPKLGYWLSVAKDVQKARAANK